MAVRGATAQQAAIMTLRKLGVVNRTQQPRQQDIQDTLDGLWLFLDTLNTESVMVPFYTKYTFTLGTTTRLLTIGPGGDLDMPAPMEILSVQLIDSDGAYHPVSLVNGIQYFQNANPAMDLTAIRPMQVIYNASLPCGTLEFNAIPAEEYTLSLAVKLPWTIDNCAACDDACGSGTAVDEADYSIAIDPDAAIYCDETCELSVIQQMRDWLNTQCEGCTEDSYTHTFAYNGLSVPATATLESRTEPNPVSFSVSRNMEFPIGYIPLIVWGLAEQMMAEYPQDNPITAQTIVKQAALIKRQIKARNATSAKTQIDPSLLANISRRYR
jgi:hypothetical protein